jgi:D-alanyl-D-alanine carboxypeptidase (penicillin-binding protein 5/6)
MKPILLTLLLLLPLFARAETNTAPALAARSYALYDYTSKQFLISQNADERTQPGSLTKLMTAYVVFGAIKQNKLSLKQNLTPSAYAVRMQNEELRMFLETGKAVMVEDLLRGLIVQSANDAARVLAEAVANHEFAFATDLMNSEAQRLGMRNTHFVNATGLPEDLHYSTAHDMALLAAAIVHDFPEYYGLYAIREYQYNGINQFNRNQLLWTDAHVDGMKTGYTEGIGFNLVASSRLDDRRLISVVLGTATESLRGSESQRLLNYGFQNYDTIRLYAADQAVNTVRVWKGTEKLARLGSHDDIYVTVPKGQRAQLKAVMETRQPLIAPVSNGQILGALKFSLADKPYVEVPLVALEGIPLANVFSRGVDTIYLLFQ